MARTTFHSQILDKETGELIEYRKNFITKNKETFIMARTTDGTDWLEDFSGNEIKLMLFMAARVDSKTQYVFMSDYNKAQIVRILKYKNERSLNTLMTSAQRKCGFKKVRKYNDTYVMNPEFTFSTHSNNYDQIKELYENA